MDGCAWRVLAVMAAATVVIGVSVGLLALLFDWPTWVAAVITGVLIGALGPLVNTVDNRVRRRQRTQDTSSDE